MKIAYLPILSFLPTGHSVGFDPNAYGEPRQARNIPSGTSYASSATYNAYGSIASFIYGSTATRTITPNLRGLPAQILDMKSGTRRLDHQLSYDPNANLAGIVDGLDGMESRTLGYLCPRQPQFCIADSFS